MTDAAAELAANLDKMADIVAAAYGQVQGIDLRAWASAIRDQDGWGVERFLQARDALGRLDYPGLAQDRFARLLVRSEALARDIR